MAAISIIPSIPGMADMFWSAIAAPLNDAAIGPSSSPSTANANMSVRMANSLFITSNVSYVH